MPDLPPVGACRHCGRTLVRLADWSSLTKRQRKPYTQTHAPNAGQSLCVACQPKVAAFERKLKRSPI